MPARRVHVPWDCSAYSELKWYSGRIKADADKGEEIGFAPLDDACERRVRFLLHKVGGQYLAKREDGELIGSYRTAAAAYRAAARAVGGMR